MREDVVVWCLVSLGCVVRGRSEGGMRWFLWGKLLNRKALCGVRMGRSEGVVRKGGVNC